MSELLTSLFMSINMVGAVLAAPLAGALADRFGRRPLLIAAALVLDALCFLGLTRDVPFPVFLAIRFVEGAAHIFALSLLLGLASGARPEAQRGLVMGATGSGLLLGVASGAPLGGRLGHPDPLVPLYVGAAVVALAAVLALLLLRETAGRESERPGLGEIARWCARARSSRSRCCSLSPTASRWASSRPPSRSCSATSTRCRRRASAC